jgi:hypothetical protein
VHLDLPFTTGVESNDTDGIKAFNADGFRLGTSTNHNVTSTNYVTYNWKVNGGTTATNDDGSADSTVQVDTTVGMSQVLYTGNATGSGAEQTIGHGLGGVPEIIIFKSRTWSGGNWYMYNKYLDSPVANIVELDTNDVEHNDADYMNAVAPTSTVFSLGYNYTTNKNAETYIAYCFRSIEGFSKYGSYTGNVADDGTVIYCGFSPALVIIKSADHSESWHMWDNKRWTRDGNPNQNVLSTNTTAVETGASTPYNIDFLSNGFKIREDHDLLNGTGDKHIFMAFAKVPVKYANAI